jgi:hypothetical protein
MKKMDPKIKRIEFVADIGCRRRRKLEEKSGKIP